MHILYIYISIFILYIRVYIISCTYIISSLHHWAPSRLLQCTNLTFGFAAAWLGGYVGRNILTEALSSEFIGFAGVFGKRMGPGEC